jgi:hypothetical protein
MRLLRPTCSTSNLSKVLPAFNTRVLHPLFVVALKPEHILDATREQTMRPFAPESRLRRDSTGR